jgi:hypothetical protein
MKKIIIFVLVMVMAFAISAARAQSTLTESKVSVVKGAVVDTDWVADKIIIRTASFDAPDEVTIYVDHDTKIIKGTSTIFFADILQDDQLTAMCVSTSFAGLKATEIVVNE